METMETMETNQIESTSKRKRKWWEIASVATVAIGMATGLYIYQANQLDTEMTEQEFSKLTDKEMEVVDTSTFTDEKLEKWYLKNRQVKGEYIYHKDNSTYVLVSVGEVKEENTFMLINGVKETKDKLAIGYDTMIMNDVPNVDIEDSIRSSLLKVKGNYDEVYVIDVTEGTSNTPQR